MKNTTTSLALALACLGGLAATNVSQAALTRISTVAVNGTSMSSAAYSGSTSVGSSTWAGSWTATIVNPQPAGYAVLPAPFVPGFTFTAFCTDIGNANANGTYNYERLAFSDAGTPTAEGVPPDPDWADGGTSGKRAAWIYNTYIGSVINADTRAAMCIAIWEALYEGSGTFDVRYRGTSAGGDDDTGRTFLATGSSTVQGFANTWLAAGVAAGFSGYDYSWFAERQSPDVQSLVGPGELTPELTVVPEPTTYLAGALLALPFLASTMRAWRRKRA